MVRRVPESELEESDPHGDRIVGMEWQGAPFTGIAVGSHAGVSIETPYLDGCVHGRCLVHDARGTLVRDYTMQHGRFIGDDRAWWPDGTMRWHRVRGPHPAYRERRWNEAGVLVAERDDTEGVNRSWYDDGTLRLEKAGDEVSRSYARDGRLLFTRHQPPSGPDTTTFDDDAMVLHLFEVLVDADFWHVAVGYLGDLAKRDRPRGIEQLRRVLTGTNGLAKIDAARCVANLRLVELVPELTALASDDTIPAKERAGGGTRGSAVSIGQAAREALALLGRG